MTEPKPGKQPQARWLARDFGELLRQQQRDNPPKVFDVLVVGSGYGGAVAAAELAGWKNPGQEEPLRICVLERGKEYLPGMFPSRMSDLPNHVRFSLPGASTPRRAREGLFDLRLGADVNVIVANALGGGSLINAGVMEQPRSEVFEKPWPKALRWPELEPYYETAKRRLGAELHGRNNTIADHPQQEKDPLRKHQAFAELAREGKFRRAAITVTMRDRINDDDVELKSCKRCGDCATGCNYGAKESLDTNLLVQAVRHGVQIYTGATVLRLDLDRESDEERWLVYATYTDELLSRRQGAAVQIRANRVILAAGTLGSTEILLRSRQANPQLVFSSQLGRRFSTNGDMIAAGYDQTQDVNAVADETQTPAERKVGPTITGIIDITGKSKDQQFRAPLVLEELAVPGPLRQAFEEVYTTGSTLHWLGRKDATKHAYEHPPVDPFAVRPQAIRRTQIYAAMGDDGAQGLLWLQQQPETTLCDGAIRVEWPGINKHPLFEAQIETLKRLAARSGLGGITIANPLWQLLPGGMEALIHGQRGPLLTVHPLGGCAMGDDIGSGVVDSLGRVFDGRATTKPGAIYDSLVVLDGSIVPSALGTNPALTIAALALRAVKELREEWELQRPGASAAALVELGPRPWFRDAEDDIKKTPKPAPTVGEFIERLVGPVFLKQANGAPKKYIAELTLHYQNKRLRELVRVETEPASTTRQLSLGEGEGEGEGERSSLRFYDCDNWRQIEDENCTHERREQRRAKDALFTAELTGTLTIMRREASTSCGRGWRALWAWLRNRGTRDLWQLLCKALRQADTPHKPQAKQSWLSMASDLWALATHAGEVRLFEYDLQIQPEPDVREDFYWAADTSKTHPLVGGKRITYARPSNPWRQLMEMRVNKMPGLIEQGKPAVLALDNRYMANRSIPLFRIASQQDQVTALTDLASLGAYFARLLLSIHLWNARLPEPPCSQTPDCLPRRLPGLPEPEIQELEVGKLAGRPVHIRLTRYPNRQPEAIPVVMFHGYSASGTTFAHPALPCDIARFLHKAGRDIWIVDARTSAGMPAVTHPWTFETVGLKDIPAAIDHIYRATGGKPMDVIAHCMGAAMFSMAVLAADTPGNEITTSWDPKFSDDFRAARRALPGRIRSAVLSQIGPLMVFSPRNVFASYVTNYLRYYLPVDNYRFRPSPEPGLAEQLLDRVLATLPYPDDELKLENPCWPPWRRTEFIGTRHRMDALYGRTFSLANLNARTLEHIDDFFGPLNAETVSQVIHFTRLQMITNRYGRNHFISRKNLREHWTFPTFSIHGVDNGLSDPATQERMRDVMLRDAGCRLKTERIKDFGHQDCWIGKDAATAVFPKILDFLEAPEAAFAAGKPPADRLLAQLPWGGPMLGHETMVGRCKVLPVSLSGEPALGRPLGVALVPVARLDAASPWQAVADGARVPLNQQIPPDAVKFQGLGNSEDWFSVDVPVSLFGTPTEGVLILTVHAQSRTLSGGSYHDPQYAIITLHNRPRSLIGVDLLPQRLCRAVQRLLMHQQADELAPGVIQRRRDNDANAFSIALGSCQYPAGMLDGVPTYSAYQRVSKRLDSGTLQAQALVLAGDQVYADATAGLFDPTQRDDNYRRAYERWLCQMPVKQVLRRLPLFTLPDDHEIYENWEPLAPDFDAEAQRRHDLALEEGRKHYARYLRHPERLAAGSPLWRQPKDLPLFLADTRTERRHRNAVRVEQAEIMLPAQFNALTTWLQNPAHRHRPKLIVSPAIFLPRHIRAVAPASLSSYALRSDGWDGYPCSMYALLGYIAEHSISNVVFLSGDEHLGCATTALVSKQDTAPVRIYSIHTSGLYAPYPFANAAPADLIPEEQFDFSTASGSYHCVVERTEFFPGNGFTLLNFTKEHRQWHLHCEFNRAGNGSGCYSCVLG